MKHEYCWSKNKNFIVNNEKQEEMLNNMEHIKQDVKDKYFS